MGPQGFWDTFPKNVKYNNNNNDDNNNNNNNNNNEHLY